MLLTVILCANGAEVDLSGLLPETIQCVSIVAPSSQPESNDVVECVRELEKAGKTVKVYPGVWHRSSNGADRAREIEAAWQDADTDLILCARGGSGSFDTLKALNFDILKSRDVTFMGFSNISTLLNAFVKMGVKRPIGGPMASTLASYPHTATSIGRAYAVLSKEDLPSSRLTVRRAPTESIVGKPLGGHFPSLASMTEEWIPDTAGRIIFLEVNSSYNYSKAVTSFDTMASHGWFEKAAAVVLCDMGINGTTAEKEDLRVYITEAVTCPVFSGYTYGHVAGMLALDYDRNLTITPSGELLWENYSPESLVIDVPKGDVSNMTSLSCGTLKKTGDGTLALLSGRNRFRSTTTIDAGTLRIVGGETEAHNVYIGRNTAKGTESRARFEMLGGSFSTVDTTSLFFGNKDVAYATADIADGVLTSTKNIGIAYQGGAVEKHVDIVIRDSAIVKVGSTTTTRLYFDSTSSKSSFSLTVKNGGTLDVPFICRESKSVVKPVVVFDGANIGWTQNVANPFKGGKTLIADRIFIGDGGAVFTGAKATYTYEYSIPLVASNTASATEARGVKFKTGAYVLSAEMSWEGPLVVESDAKVSLTGVSAAFGSLSLVGQLDLVSGRPVALTSGGATGSGKISVYQDAAKGALVMAKGEYSLITAPSAARRDLEVFAASVLCGNLSDEVEGCLTVGEEGGLAMLKLVLGPCASVGGRKIDCAHVFEVANSRVPIVYPTDPVLGGEIGAQTIDFEGTTVKVPIYYTATLSGTTVTLELNDNARPRIADGDGDKKAIAVGETSVSLHIANPIDGFLYRVVTAKTLADEWIPVTEFTSDSDFDIEREKDAKAAFYRIEVTDVVRQK